MRHMEKVRPFFAYKVFLRDKEKLLITHDIFGDWDLPGGRVRKNEFGGPREEVIARKIREELGDKVRYELGDFQTIFQVTRHEHNLDREVQILALGYAATYLGGEIQLGDHHDKFEWVDVGSFKPVNYFTGGWLAGVQEYLKVQRGRNN